MLIQTYDDYCRLLHDYHRIHADVWKYQGQDICRPLLQLLNDLAHHLDAYHPGWWKERLTPNQ